MKQHFWVKGSRRFEATTFFWKFVNVLDNEVSTHSIRTILRHTAVKPSWLSTVWYLTIQSLLQREHIVSPLYRTNVKCHAGNAFLIHNVLFIAKKKSLLTIFPHQSATLPHSVSSLTPLDFNANEFLRTLNHFSLCIHCHAGGVVQPNNTLQSAWRR